MNTRIYKQSGSVLIEALIAILIFSVGILALVGMQATAIATVSDAKYRADASLLANQIIGAMWANRIVDASGVVSLDNTFACADCITSASGVYSANGGNDYTMSWGSSVIAALPRPAAQIAISGVDVTVTLNWRPPQATTNHNHTVTARIN